MGEFGKGVRVEEKLTSRIKNILRDYNCSVGDGIGLAVVQEFLANGEDAQATQFSIVLNKKTYKKERIVSPKLSEWQGPALCFYNDSKFSERDWAGFARIGDSDKSAQRKIGQFGLGCMTGFCITDVFQILSHHTLAFFDPHKTYIASNGENMRLGDLREVETEVIQDHLEAFAGIEQHLCKEDDGRISGLNGTIFRLPLRSEHTISEICQEPVGLEQLEDLLERIGDMAKELIMFTKNIRQLSAYIIEEDGSMSCITQVEKEWTLPRQLDMLTNLSVEEIQLKRRLMHNLSHCENDSPQSETFSFFIVSQCVEDGEQGMRDVELAACIREESKEGTNHFPQLEGQLFYVLPLGLAGRNLPVHVNARFKMASNRSLLTGKNDELARSCIGPLWAHLIQCLVEREGTATNSGGLSPNTILDREWPPCSLDTLAPQPLNLAGDSMISTLAKEEDYKFLWTCAGGGRLVSVSEALFLPRDISQEVIDVCLQIGLPITQPPDRVVEHLKKEIPSGINELTPSKMRHALRGRDITVCRKAIYEVLCFLLSCDEFEDMNDIMLIPLTKGRWGAFKHIANQGVQGENIHYVCGDGLHDLPTLVQEESMSFLDTDCDQRLAGLFLNKELQKQLNIKTPGPEVVGPNLKCPLDADLLQKVWDILKSWNEEDREWEPFFESHPLVPMRGGKWMSLLDCRRTHALSPCVHWKLPPGVPDLLLQLGCPLMDSSAHNIGVVPCTCCSQGDESRRVAAEVLNSICKTGITEVQPEGMCDSSIQELRVLLSKAPGYQEKLKQMPIFESVEGKLVCPAQCITLTPLYFGSSLFYPHMEPKSRLLKWESWLYGSGAMVPQMDTVTFFVRHIFPGLSTASGRTGQEVTLMNAAFEIFESLCDEDRRGSCRVLENMPVVFDKNTGMFCKACDFTCGRLTKTLSKGAQKHFKYIDEGPGGYSGKSMNFLKRIGLHSNLDKDSHSAILTECVKCMDHLEIRKSTQRGPYCCVDIISAIVKKLNEQQGRSAQWVPPGELQQLLRGQVFPTGPLLEERRIGVSEACTRLIRLEEGADGKHLNLVASSMPILAKELGDMGRLRRLLGVPEMPPIDNIIQHLTNIAKPEGLYNQWESLGEPLKALDDDYRAVWAHLFEASRKEDEVEKIVEDLRGHRCIQVSRGQFVQVSECSFDVDEHRQNAPFPLPQDMRSPGHEDLLRRLGALRFLWNFLEKIGCKDVREKQSENLCLGVQKGGKSVVEAILDGLESVAPNSCERFLLVQNLFHDTECWDALREHLGHADGCFEDKIAELPVFGTTTGTYIAPANESGKVCLLPETFDLDTVHALLKEGAIHVLKNSEECDKALNQSIQRLVPQENGATFFKKFLLKCLGNAQSSIFKENRMELLMKGIHCISDEMSVGNEREWLLEEAIVMDPDSGEFFRASEYVVSTDPFFHSIIGIQRGPHTPGVLQMLPSVYRVPDIQQVLVTAGLVTELNPGILYQCLEKIQEMDERVRNSKTEDIVKVMNMCGSHACNLSEDCKRLLYDGCLFPTNIGDEPAWSKLANATDYKDKLLVHPHFPVLNQDLMNMQRLRQAIALPSSPDIDKVVWNIIQWRKRDGTSAMLESSTSGAVRTAMQEAFTAAWSYLSTELCSREGRSREILLKALNRLKGEKCILLDSGRVVEPNLSYDQAMDSHEAPFKVPEELRHPQYRDLMEYFDVGGDPEKEFPQIRVEGDPPMKRLIEHLTKCFNTEDDTDVVLLCGDEDNYQQLYGHKLMLMRYEFFERKLSADWESDLDGKQRKMINLAGYPGATYDGLYCFLQYVYRGEILAPDGSELKTTQEETEELLLDLLKLSDLFDDGYLKSSVEEKMVLCVLSPQNCCEIFSDHEEYRAPQLKQQCITMIERNYEQLKHKIDEFGYDLRKELNLPN